MKTATNQEKDLVKATEGKITSNQEKDLVEATERKITSDQGRGMMKDMVTKKGVRRITVEVITISKTIF